MVTTEPLTGRSGVSAEYFAGRLRELREAAGLTQGELARQANSKVNTIARLERGERKPTWETVVALAAALGVPTDTFLKPPAKRPPAGPGRPPKQPPEKPRRKPKK
jgi:transcriptional regulator with XRE-family HTH domain